VDRIVRQDELTATTVQHQAGIRRERFDGGVNLLGRRQLKAIAEKGGGAVDTPPALSSRQAGRQGYRNTVYLSSSPPPASHRPENGARRTRKRERISWTARLSPNSLTAAVDDS
jgi:hypothetical protein